MNSVDDDLMLKAEPILLQLFMCLCCFSLQICDADNEVDKISPDEEAEKLETNNASGAGKNNNRDTEKQDKNHEELSTKVRLNQKECLCKILRMK